MKAGIIINQNFKIGEVDKRLYGSFIEHLGRAVYGGIYEPDHATADDAGFRQDVLDLVKKLNVPIVRYPGGNFVSGYNWEDGTGDKSKRPRRMELAWEVIETNQVGIDEFQDWAKRADSQVLMAVNLGTRGPKEAQDCVEYCNSTTDTYYANKRRENGFEKPFGIKTWCLGNEMDGAWQICSKTAQEYARTAVEAAKLMKLVDPTIELVACGSSNYNMRTFGDWELTVLDQAYDYVDYISLHQYYGNYRNDSEGFLACSVHMDQFIKSVAAMCDVIKAKKHSDKTVNLSFDEWNVWYHSKAADAVKEKWTVAAPQLEDIYNFEDALLVGSMLMTLQNNCDRVKIACLAQLVNVIAPIMTENGGKAWAQTIFYPFMYASANGRGTALQTVIDCEEYATQRVKKVPYLDASVIHDAEKREVNVFLVNRSLTDSMDVDLNFQDFEALTAVEHVELYNDDLKAVNTADCEAVAPAQINVTAIEGNTQTVTIKKHSWNMLKYKY